MIICAMLYSVALALVVLFGLLSAYCIKISWKDVSLTGWAGTYVGFAGVVFSLAYTTRVILDIMSLCD